MNEIAIESMTTVEGVRKPHLTVSLDRLESLLRGDPQGPAVSDMMALICRAAVEARGGDGPLAGAEATRYEAETGPGERRYVTTWRNKFLCTDTRSYDEFIATLAGAVAVLTEWKVKGVLFASDGGTRDDYALFYTFDAALAKELGFDDERAMFGDDDDCAVEEAAQEGAGEAAQAGDVAGAGDKEWVETKGEPYDGQGWDRPDQRDFL